MLRTSSGPGPSFHLGIRPGCPAALKGVLSCERAIPGQGSETLEDLSGCRELWGTPDQAEKGLRSDGRKLDRGVGERSKFKARGQRGPDILEKQPGHNLDEQ